MRESPHVAGESLHSQVGGSKGVQIPGEKPRITRLFDQALRGEMGTRIARASAGGSTSWFSRRPDLTATVIWRLVCGPSTSRCLGCASRWRKRPGSGMWIEKPVSGRWRRWLKPGFFTALAIRTFVQAAAGSAPDPHRGHVESLAQLSQRTPSHSARSADRGSSTTSEVHLALICLRFTFSRPRGEQFAGRAIAVM